MAINNLLPLFLPLSLYLDTLQDFMGTDRAELKPLLFPCSDLHMETLPSILQEAGLPLSCVVSYRTIPHPDLQRCLREEEEVCALPPIFVTMGMQCVPETVVPDVLHAQQACYSPSRCNGTQEKKV